MTKASYLKRIRWMTGLFMAGLVLSGVTAMPLVAEFNFIVDWLGLSPASAVPDPSSMSHWFWAVREGLIATQAQYPFMFYGTDWLAFGHFIIALAFLGAWRDPVRNIWLFQFGLLACAAVIPFALIFGGVRGIPIWWRWIDGCFGLAGTVPLALGWHWARRLESMPVRS